MFEPIVIWIEWKLKAFLVWLMEGIALGLWYIEKACAWLADQIITNTVWETIVDSLVTSMSTSMPASLRTLLFGTGGGLFYIALMLISLTMIMPYFFQKGQQVIQLERLFAWSILVIALFISSTAGYDAIGLIETTRQDTIAGITSSWGTGNTSDFVARPMSATAAEINITEFELPAAFVSTYFPDPTGYNTETIVFYDAPLIGSNTSTFLVETEVSMSHRIAQGSLGLVLAILNLIPMAMVVILGLTFAMLTASALILIIFFVVALPLGIFEAGGNLLAQIATRYMTIWLLSIFISIFPSMLLGVAELTLSPPVTLTGLFTYIAILIVAVIATHHLAKWVYQISVEGFAVIGQSINATLQPYAYGGDIRHRLPGVDYLPPSYANASLGGAAAAAALPHVAGPALAASTIAGSFWLGSRFDRGRPPGMQSGMTVEEGSPATTPHVFQYIDPPQLSAPDVTEETPQLTPYATGDGPIRPEVIITEPKRLPEPTFRQPPPIILLGNGEANVPPATPFAPPPIMIVPNGAPNRSVNDSVPMPEAPSESMPSPFDGGSADGVPFPEMAEFPPDLPESFGEEA